MNTMILHDTAPLATGRWTAMTRSDLWQHSFAAGLAVALHGVVVLLLINNWAPEAPAVKPPKVMTTQLVMLAPTVQAPAAEPVPAPEPMPVAEPVVAAAVSPSVPVEATKPLIDPQIEARKIEQAALARKRVQERQREQQAEQQRQQQVSREREQAAEQQRQAQQKAQQQAQQAEQSRLSAERARQQAAADSRQYLPLSKEAPEYPARALDKNIEGDCSVEYTVNPKGQIENPKVLDGCHPLFIRPSLAAAQTFRYQPRIVDGVAVAVPSVRNTFHFRIK